MKKIAALIIVLSLLLFIVGCESYEVKQGRIQVEGDEISDNENSEECEETCTVELIEEPSEEEPEEIIDDEHI
jgi:hypothetical protein